MEFNNFCKEYCAKYQSEMSLNFTEADWLDFVDRECTCCPHVELESKLLDMKEKYEPRVTDICIVHSNNTVHKYRNVTDCCVETMLKDKDHCTYQMTFTSSKPIEITEDSGR